MFLCYNNFYQEHEEKSKYYIKFNVNKNDISRQSTNYYKLNDFPVMVPFSAIEECNNAILNGKFIKQDISASEETKDIVMIKSKYIKKMSDDDLQDMVEIIQDSDMSFLLTGKSELDIQSRLLDDIVTTIYHCGDWGRTCVIMSDYLCPLRDRKYCWTKSVPDVNLKIFGPCNHNDMQQIHDVISQIGIQNYAVSWED